MTIMERVPVVLRIGSKLSKFWAIISKFPRRMKIGYIETVRMTTLS